VPADTAAVVVDVNRVARMGALRVALTVVALVGVIALFFTIQIPARQPGAIESPP
jgi:hypothetical protein